MIEDTLSKVENDGRVVVVKSKDGKNVKLKISGSRTEFEGIDTGLEVLHEMEERLCGV